MEPRQCFAATIKKPKVGAPTYQKNPSVEAILDNSTKKYHICTDANGSNPQLPKIDLNKPYVMINSEDKKKK